MISPSTFRKVVCQNGIPNTHEVFGMPFFSWGSRISREFSFLSVFSLAFLIRETENLI